MGGTCCSPEVHLHAADADCAASERIAVVVEFDPDDEGRPLSSRLNRADVYVMNLDGSALRNVTESAAMTAHQTGARGLGSRELSEFGGLAPGLFSPPDLPPGQYLAPIPEAAVAFAGRSAWGSRDRPRSLLARSWVTPRDVGDLGDADDFHLTRPNPERD